MPNNKEEDVKNNNTELNENFKVEINNSKDILVVDDIIAKEKSRGNLLGDIPIMLRTKKGTKRNKKQKDEIIETIGTDEDVMDNSSCCTQGGDKSLMVDEHSISKWSYG